MQNTTKESSYFNGFVLYNPSTGKELINHNGNKYFTPASTTKLFTFYTAYRTLKDSVISLAFHKTTDSLIIKGTADPTFLYGFEKSTTLDFLKNTSDSIYLVDEIIDETPFGNGWSWGDYQYYYMPEKSLFPMYGNILNYSLSGDTLTASPTYLKKNIVVLDSTSINREINSNQFYIANKKKRTSPFITSNTLVAELLADTLNKKVQIIKNNNFPFKTYYGLAYKEVYKKMLEVSDNFIAEQLLLQVGKEVADSYSVNKAIAYSLENYLPNLPNKPRWVDGSGLSRYNLFTPNDMIHLLKKMHREIPRAELLNYFAVGGKSGTLKNWYANDTPYVYAKSGTLSNNHNLCGYIITKKGTLLIFSSMNNHYKISTTQLKQGMEKLFKKIYHTY